VLVDRQQEIEEHMRTLVNPPHLWRGSTLKRDKSVVPCRKGVYAWYFNLSGELPFPDPLCVDGRALLYIGIAGQNASSSDTLRARVVSQHLLGAGHAEGSTLRRSVGCFLADRLGIHLQRKGTSTVWFNEDGEDILSQWLVLNTSVAWIVDEKPWEVETAMFQKHGKSLLFNIRDNPSNPFREILSELRSRCRKEAFASQ